MGFNRHHKHFAFTLALALAMVSIPAAQAQRGRPDPSKWVKFNRPEEFRKKSIRKEICREVKKYFTDLEVREKDCLAGKVVLHQKYVTVDRPPGSSESKRVTTLMKGGAFFGKIRCEIELRLRFAGRSVRADGEIVYISHGWDARVIACGTRRSEALMSATPSSPNVKPIAMEKISEDILSNIGEVDIEYELGDGYYSLVDQPNNPTYFIVFHPENPKEVIGYMTLSVISYTEDNEPPGDYLIRFDPNGYRVSPKGHYW